MFRGVSGRGYSLLSAQPPDDAVRQKSKSLFYLVIVSSADVPLVIPP